MTVQAGPAAPAPTSAPVPAPDADPFQIAATGSLQERRLQSLKHDDTFAVFDQDGDASPDPGSPTGLYHRDTRHLSHFALRLSGRRPLLLGSTPRDDNAALACDLTNPDLISAEGTIEHDLVHLRRTKLLWDAACFERLSVHNFAQRPLRVRLEVRFGADFADLFEVRGTPRPRRGVSHAPELGDAAVVLAYTGLDGVRRTTELRFDPAPARLEADRAVFDLDLPADGRALLFFEARCGRVRASGSDAQGRGTRAQSTPGLGTQDGDAQDRGTQDGDAQDRGTQDGDAQGRGTQNGGAQAQSTPGRGAGERFLAAFRASRRALRASAARTVGVETSNEVFNEALRRSAADLAMLVTHAAHGPYPYAGIPWFSAPFGRDALVTALQTLWMDPSLARGVLLYLAANQATGTDPAADAEPGKILHEVRHGEMAELGEVPFRRYYGSVDATPLFVVLAGAYLDRTGDLDTLQSLWPHVEAALHWMDTHGDRDGDGFLEYSRMTGQGLQNQGWKDSHDAVFHADGSPAQGPVALCEVQAYAFAARRAAAGVARALGRVERAAALEARADALGARFEAAFWCEGIGSYALALDGAKRPCRVRASNAGHALLAGIASPGRARRVADTLLSGASFSGWGIRTVAAGEARYNPMSYHNGSVWPHDNALVAMGFGRYGMRAEAARVLEGLFAASGYMDLRRLPELFCGLPRRRGQGPTLYPVACAPQAWAAAAAFGLLQACLGLGFDPAGRAVTFDRPVLPAFLDRVVLRGLRVGEARVDVALARTDGTVGLTVLSPTDGIRVVLAG